MKSQLSARLRRWIKEPKGRPGIFVVTNGRSPLEMVESYCAAIEEAGPSLHDHPIQFRDGVLSVMRGHLKTLPIVEIR